MTRARAHAFIATSVDGFIARPDGSIDWLQAANATLPPDEGCGWKQFFEPVDAVVMGRHTFEQVRDFQPWPYRAKPVVVLTSGDVHVPDALCNTVYTSGESPAVLLQRLGAGGLERVYVDGGATVQSFLRAGLLDEITITTVPVLLGRGRPLFGELDRDIPLTLLDARHWPFGFAQRRYRIG